MAKQPRKRKGGSGRSRIPRPRSKRHANHDAAMREAESHTYDMPDHPLIPAGDPIMVTKQEELSELADHVREVGRFGYDTEFIGETSYFPHLCLIQISTEQRVALIDPLEEIDLTDLWELIADESLQTLVHAGEQDLEPIQRLIGKEPANVFDTQVAAGFAGQPYPVSLQHLVHSYSGVRLGKGMTFTRWDIRPLSPVHLRYAADDVRYLPIIYDKLIEALQNRGHLELAQRACAELCSGSNSRPSAEDQYVRLAKNQRMVRKELAVLRELVKWRDEAARKEDLPPRAMLRDDVLVGLSKRPVKDAQKFDRVRNMPRPIIEQYGSAIVDSTAKALGLPQADWPHATRFEEGAEERFENDAVWAALGVYAMSRGIDLSVIASRLDVAKMMRDFRKGKSVGEYPLMTGWRLDAVGAWFKQFLAGDQTLSWKFTGE